MKNNMQAMLRQVQQMQARLAKVQEELDEVTAEGQAGGGMVTATVNGKNRVVGIKLEKEVVDPNDIEMLQDLISAAVNTALDKVSELVSEKMSGLTGGMKIPGMF